MSALQGSYESVCATARICLAHCSVLEMHFLSGYGVWECDTKDNHVQHSHPGSSTCASSVRGWKISIPSAALTKTELTNCAMIIVSDVLYSGVSLFHQMVSNCFCYERVWSCNLFCSLVLFSASFPYFLWCVYVSMSVCLCVVLQRFGRPETRARTSTSILTLSWCEKRREWRWNWRSECR